MPSYVLSGYRVAYDNSNNPVSVGDASIDLYFPTGNAATFSYTNSGTGDAMTSDVTDSGAARILLDGVWTDMSAADALVMDISWNGNTTTVLQFTFYSGNGATDYYFAIGGTPVPALTTPEAFLVFDGLITGVTPVTSGPLAPGQTIAISSLLGVTENTANDIVGTSGDDTLYGLSGYDDVYLPGHSAPNGGDLMFGSDGDDVYDLTGATGVDYYTISYENSGNAIQSSPITATIDGANGTLEIVSPTGHDVVAGVADAFGAEGITIRGTLNGDTFVVNSTNGGYLQLRGNGGNDLFELHNTDGRVRLSYDNATTGIDANLAVGAIYDGLGGVDTVNYDAGVALELRASHYADNIMGTAYNDRFILEGGDDTLDGGAGFDTLRFNRPGVAALVVDLSAGTATGTWNGTAFTAQISNIEGVVGATDTASRITGSINGDALAGGSAGDVLIGGAGNDTLNGNDGADTLNGGDGDDSILGGATSADLRDVVYAGAGNDWVDGGYGNDSLRGDDGNDTIEGGFGADTVVGGAGNDVLTGSAWSDQIFGNDGDDFINGGFGNDRLNGGTGADRFYHLGVAGHGSDWVQDYSGADNDVLVFGNAAASLSQFQINWATTAGAGDAGVQEAFVIYRPTGQIMWALIDGAAQGHIWLQIGANTYDMLALS